MKNHAGGYSVSSLIILIVIMAYSPAGIPQAHSENAPVLKGKYLGQPTPGIKAVRFGSDIFVSGGGSFNLSFSPDDKELYYSFIKATEARPEPRYEIKGFMQVDGIWRGPETAAFSGTFSDVDITFSPDGRRLFFASERPHSESAGFDIYYLEKEEGGWSRPIYAGTEVNSMFGEVYPSLSRQGKLFFRSNRPGGFGDDDIYTAEWKGKTFTNVTNLGPAVNSEYHESNSFVAQDESYLLYVTNRPETGNRYVIYVSFQTGGGTWSPGVSLGDAVNSGDGAGAPTLSPDGKFLFFSRRGSDRGLYWISTEVIERLRPSREP